MYKLIPEPWLSMVLVVSACVCVWLFAYMVTATIEFFFNLRRDLRERYLHGQEASEWIDIGRVPAWLLVEVACVVITIVFGGLMLFTAYSAATSDRNWWHAGDRNCPPRN